jgi:deoxyribodipyrimidine photolyase
MDAGGPEHTRPGGRAAPREYAYAGRVHLVWLRVGALSPRQVHAAVAAAASGGGVARVHTPWEAGGAPGYPPPIVDHDDARRRPRRVQT